MMILAGLCDLLDGPVARRQSRVSLFGGFLDSILDRYADLILFLGLLVYYVHVNRFPYAFLAGAAMAGAVMVSYAKARAESLVPGPGVGFWERPERLVLMILGALTNRMPLALWILAIGPNITVIHNIVHTWQQTERGRRALHSPDDRTRRAAVFLSVAGASRDPRCSPRDDSFRRPRRLARFAFRTTALESLETTPRFLTRIIAPETNRRGSNFMPKLIAVVGALVICAGIDLLWQSYAQIQYWFEAYVAFFKSTLAAPAAGSRSCFRKELREESGCGASAAGPWIRVRSRPPPAVCKPHVDPADPLEPGHALATSPPTASDVHSFFQSKYHLQYASDMNMLPDVVAHPASQRRSGCPVSISLEVFGDRWSLLIVRDLMVRGFRTFKEFEESGEGIATNILADRLQKLEANGIILAEADADGRAEAELPAHGEGNRSGAGASGTADLGGAARADGRAVRFHCGDGKESRSSACGNPAALARPRPDADASQFREVVKDCREQRIVRKGGARHEQSASSGGHTQGRVHPDLGRQAREMGRQRPALRGLGDLSPERIARSIRTGFTRRSPAAGSGS